MLKITTVVFWSSNKSPTNFEFATPHPWRVDQSSRLCHSISLSSPVLTSFPFPTVAIGSSQFSGQQPPPFHHHESLQKITSFLQSCHVATLTGILIAEGRAREAESMGLPRFLRHCTRAFTGRPSTQEEDRQAETPQHWFPKMSLLQA